MDHGLPMASYILRRPDMLLWTAVHGHRPILGAASILKAVGIALVISKMMSGKNGGENE